MVETITKSEFLQGYEEGFIIDVVTVGNYIYGKDPRGMNTKYKVVRAAI